MRKIILIFITLTLVASCGPSTNFVENKTDYYLCYGLAKYPSYNIHTKNRKAEIRKRGVDCKQYENRIDKQLAEEELARASSPVYNSSFSSNNSSTERKLKQLDSNLSFQCIMSGGVYGGDGMCFWFDKDFPL